MDELTLVAELICRGCVDVRCRVRACCRKPVGWHCVGVADVIGEEGGGERDGLTILEASCSEAPSSTAADEGGGDAECDG